MIHTSSSGAQCWDWRSTAMTWSTKIHRVCQKPMTCYRGSPLMLSASSRTSAANNMPLSMLIMYFVKNFRTRMHTGRSF